MEKHIAINQKGITLIALVITIVVLLIFAGVSFNLVLGNNGIIAKAKEAKEETVIGQEKEEIKRARLSVLMHKTKNEDKIATASEMQNELTKMGANVKTTPAGKNVIIKYIDTNHEYTIRQTGNITDKIEIIESEEKCNEGLEWLYKNNLIVTDATQYQTQYPGIGVGTVFLNYDINQKEIYRPKELSLASAQLALSLISAYYKTTDTVYLERAIKIGENTINNKTFKKEYAHSSNDTGKMLTCIASQMKMNDKNEWSYDESCYTYSLDSLMSCKFLIELTNITGDNKYANTALEVIDSWIYIQEQMGKDGALPEYIYYTTELSWGEGMWPTWTDFPLDISYSIYLAGTSAYNYTNDNKYKTFVDNYYQFVYDSFEKNNGTFTYTKNGNKYILPYEYMCLENSELTGKNKSNQDSTTEKNNDITTDQLFYIVLGLALYDSDSKYVTEFLKTIENMQLDNGKFWGEYTIEGNKGTYYETDIEIVNSAFYERLLKICNKTENISNINAMLEEQKKSSDDQNINGAWTWNASTSSYIIETLATSVIIQELYTNGMP